MICDHVQLVLQLKKRLAQKCNRLLVKMVCQNAVSLYKLILKYIVCYQNDHWHIQIVLKN